MANDLFKLWILIYILREWVCVTVCVCVCLSSSKWVQPYAPLLTALLPVRNPTVMYSCSRSWAYDPATIPMLLSRPPTITTGRWPKCALSAEPTGAESQTNTKHTVMTYCTTRSQVLHQPSNAMLPKLIFPVPCSVRFISAAQCFKVWWCQRTWACL